MLIEVLNAAFGYGGREVVAAEALRVGRGGFMGIYGPNGSGKTTLVRGLLGLLKPVRGRVERAPDLRVAYLPQHRVMQLHWPMTGMDAAALSISAGRRWGRVRRAKRTLRGRMSQLGVDELANEPFARLSGGQQQRLLLAGLLAASPDVLVLDEPTDGLDFAARKQFIGQLASVSGADAAVVMISHNLDELLAVADHIAQVHPGAGEGGASRVDVAKVPADPAKGAAT